jgi:uncharacterized protein YhbP (UPF0306 family)
MPGRKNQKILQALLSRRVPSLESLMGCQNRKECNIVLTFFTHVNLSCTYLAQAYTADNNQAKTSLVYEKEMRSTQLTSVFHMHANTFQNPTKSSRSLRKAQIWRLKSQTRQLSSNESSRATTWYYESRINLRP